MMDNNWLLTEVMAEQREEALRRVDLGRVLDERALAHQGLRPAIAAGLVRLGMTLDRSAGERAAVRAHRTAGEGAR